MALIGNNSILNRLPIRQFGGTISSRYVGAETPASCYKNRYTHLTWSKAYGNPPGHSHPMAWIMPLIEGGMISKQISAGGTVTTANTNLGLQITGSSSATGAITSSTMQIIIDLTAALAASGALTSANMSILANITASLAATGSITTADLSIIIGMTASLAASGTISLSTLTQTLPITASISNAAAGQATPEQIAAAVWNAILADYNSAGSTGAALGDAGGAGNPWSALLADNNDPNTFGERVQKLLTKGQFIGLK